jgi:thiol-disulfide isomerase/thioredoxin
VLTGVLVVVVALAAAAAFGTWRRLTDGRIRGVAAPGARGGARTERPDREPLPSPDAGGDQRPAASQPDSRRLSLDEDDLGDALGARATLVQFSTAFCQPCRAARRVLSDVATQVEGVRHVEIDAESHLDLVRRLDVFRTPTVFVLDSTGLVIRKAVGAPRKADVIAALGEAI